MMVVEVKQVSMPLLRLGEGPRWLEEQQALVLVDCFAKELRRHFVDTSRNQVLHIKDGGTSKMVNFVIPVEGEPELMVVGVGNKVSLVHWPPSDPDSHTTTPITLHTFTDDHFNVAKCDPQGRLWAGTLSPTADNIKPVIPNAGGLYRFDHDLVCTKWAKDVTISNGMTWSADRKHFYYVDSLAYCIYQFDYNDTEGTISNQRVLLDYEAAGLKDQAPDGMTTDVDGNLWVACFAGNQVICVDPRECRVVRRVALPVSQVTSVCWGGPDYSTLYVTSAQVQLSPEQLAASPTAGATFAVTGLGTKGFPPPNYKVDLKKLRDIIKK
ncbi:hypothetical protein Pcinc_018146 [Petrolisthes cinctipes]|uniref:Regucalcin n=1 Tax=Petrolisthes cinctipes TaxID=88211 RepID=A0AAE1FP74_PETCI|nr:hypothetical protein Pcinc_018146 [Petrolisthes cinctipes]